MKKVLIAVIIVMALLSTITITAEPASVTRTLNQFDELVVTQDAYEPIEAIGGFSKPKDIYVDEDDYVYIANTGSQEIVILNNNYEEVKRFGSDKLIKPSGVFVREEYIYIADYGKDEDDKTGRIYIYEFDKSSNQVTLKEEFSRPNSSILAVNDFIYRPLKIAVDNNKTIYVVSEGSYNGILMISNENRFLGFFASNNVKGTLRDYVLQFLYGNSEKAMLKKKIPPSPYNLYLDDSGYVYTITQTSTIEENKGDNIKKVNIGGINFFSNKMVSASDFTSVTTGHFDNIYAINKSGFIYEYDNEGNILFVFGGPSGGSNNLGLFEYASGVAVNSSNQLFVLDENTNEFHIFERTVFTKTVHKALVLYKEGKYLESKSVWEEVLKYNSLFYKAHTGIGKAYFSQGEYQKALEKFAISGELEEYSLAYWEIRNIWLGKYAGTLLILAFLIVAIVITIKKTGLIMKLKSNTYLTSVSEKGWLLEVKFMFKYLRHPLDSFYEAKSKNKGKVKTGLIFILVFLIFYFMFLLFSGQLFKPVILERTRVIDEVAKLLIPFVTFVLANYLVSALMEGEGTFKEIFINTIGSLMPLLVILPVITIFSNLLSYNEQFIYYFLIFLATAWSAFLLFFSVKDTHNFTVKETIYHLVMSLLMMIIMIVIAIMVYLMIRQVYDFILDIFKEMIINA